MKVGIIGSGSVAKFLAAGFIKYGHEVKLGTRDEAKLKDWLVQNPKISVGNAVETAQFGELIVVAVKGYAASETLKIIGEENLKGKTIIDVTNPLADKPQPPVNGVLQFFTDLNESLMEKLQKQVPSAHFVKAFSCVGGHLMVDPKFEEGKPTMFIAGNNDAAKKTVENILIQFGWDVADMGKAEAARAIEPLCILWCIPGFNQNQWSHAFKLLRK